MYIPLISTRVHFCHFVACRRYFATRLKRLIRFHLSTLLQIMRVINATLILRVARRPCLYISHSDFIASSRDVSEEIQSSSDDVRKLCCKTRSYWTICLKVIKKKTALHSKFNWHSGSAFLVSREGLNFLHKIWSRATWFLYKPLKLGQFFF